MMNTSDLQSTSACGFDLLPISFWASGFPVPSTMFPSLTSISLNYSFPLAKAKFKRLVTCPWPYPESVHKNEHPAHRSPFNPIAPVLHLGNLLPPSHCSAKALNSSDPYPDCKIIFPTRKDALSPSKQIINSKLYL